VKIGNGCCIFWEGRLCWENRCFVFSFFFGTESGSNGVIRLYMMAFHDFMRAHHVTVCIKTFHAENNKTSFSVVLW
jgi:hypothetical protein